MPTALGDGVGGVAHLAEGSRGEEAFAEVGVLVQTGVEHLEEVRSRLKQYVMKLHYE